MDELIAIIPAKDDSCICYDAIMQLSSLIAVCIGVDGDFRSAERLSCRFSRDKNVTVYLSEENVGPSLMRNSLAYLADAERLLIFDADDGISHSFIDELAKEHIHSNADITLALCEDDAEPYERKYRSPGIYNRDSLLDIGGFNAAAFFAENTELFIRARARGLIISHCPMAVVKRHVHSNSLSAVTPPELKVLENKYLHNLHRIIDERTASIPLLKVPLLQVM